jgi:hypothetical protein
MADMSGNVTAFGIDDGYWISKPGYLKSAFDDLYADPQTRSSRFAEALELLADQTTSLAWLTKNWTTTRGTIADADLEHFQVDWLNHVEGLEAYLRKAFTAAITHAQQRNVPVDAVLVGSPDGRVGVAYVDNSSSVTVVLRAPLGPAESKPRPRLDADDAHIVPAD